MSAAIKIKIGSVNYGDKLTPLIFVNFHFGILVNVIAEIADFRIKYKMVQCKLTKQSFNN